MRQSLPNIVITGFMGTGKTTVGKKVAQLLGKTFYDFDQIIEERMKISIKEIFEKYGEIFFRDTESKIVIEFVSKTDVVIATGGGTLLFNNNYSVLSENSIIFCLIAQKDILRKRLENSFGRPLLSGGALSERIECLLNERKALYQKLPNPIDTSNLSLSEVASKIIEIYNQHLVTKKFNVDKK